LERDAQAADKIAGNRPPIAPRRSLDGLDSLGMGNLVDFLLWTALSRRTLKKGSFRLIGFRVKT